MPAPDTTGWTVSRDIPVPSSISPQAQATLAAGAVMLEAAKNSDPPSPEDHDAWREFISLTDSLMLGMFEANAAGFEGSVERTTIAETPVFVITPASISDVDDAPIYLDIHGGALVMGGGECCKAMGKIMAGRTNMVTWSVDYRMPPEHPYPAGLDDCVAVYRALLEQRDPDRIVVGGASAGGNLAAALVLRARDEGLPLPAACVLLSPEVDLTESGDSFCTNLGVDSALPRSLAPSIALYASGADLTSPYLSPLFGDFSKPFPRTFLQTGTRDLFLSNTVRMHRALRSGGVAAELHVFEAMPHGGFWGAPEDRELELELRRFLAGLAT
jgi:epsilon-lactone hydrolase